MKIESQFPSRVILCSLIAVFSLATHFSGHSKNCITPHISILAVDELRTDPGYSNEGLLLHIANEISALNKVFFKAYLLVDDDLGAEPSRNLYLEVFDMEGQIVIDQIHPLEGHIADGAINFPKNTPPGKYRLRAHTPHMLNRPIENYVERTIFLIDSKSNGIRANSDEIQLRIEGHSLISGKENRLILGTNNSWSDSKWENARVMNNEGSVVSVFTKCTNRLGTALLTPDPGQSYFVQLENGSRLAIPPPKTQGYTLQVNNLDSELAIARIHRSSVALNDSIWLNGRIGGKAFFNQPLEWINNSALIYIDKRLLPTGLLKLRLQDNADSTLALRPLFVHNPEYPLTYKTRLGPDSTNTLKFLTGNMPGSPPKVLALSVNRDVWGNTLLPGLDAIAKNQLTRMKEGGRSLSRINNFAEDLLVQLEYGEYPGENTRITKLRKPSASRTGGIEFSAYVYDLNNELLVDTPIQIYVKSDQGISILEVDSDSEGLITVEGLNFTGTAEFTFRTTGSDTKSRLVKAMRTVRKETFNLPAEQKFTKPSPTKGFSGNPERMPYDTVGLIRLDEATVSERRISLVKEMKSIHGIVIPGKRVIFQDHAKPKSLDQLLMEIPGVRIQGLGGMDPKVSVPQGRGQVMWVIDGYMLPQDFDGSVLGYPINSTGPIRDFTSHTDIDRIDLLVGNDAALFGSRGSGGVIVITTRTGNDVEFIDRKQARLLVRGYEPRVDFDSYMEELSRREKERATLLYWNPEFNTSRDGTLDLEIPSAFEGAENFKINYSLRPADLIDGPK